MATATQIYDEYAVPEGLRKHMLRVAAIGKVICDHWTGPEIDEEKLLRVLLLHDTGNIIKMGIEDAKDDLPENVDESRLEELQNKYVSEHGDDDHAISEAIARDVGLTDDEIELMAQKVFMKNHETVKLHDWEAKIGAYADQRVAPDGVMSLKGRLQEAKERYKDQPGSSMNNPRTDEMIEHAYMIEEQIMEHCTLDPDEITSERIQPVMSDLRSFEIEQK